MVGRFHRAVLCLLCREICRCLHYTKKETTDLLKKAFLKGFPDESIIQHWYRALENGRESAKLLAQGGKGKTVAVLPDSITDPSWCFKFI